MTPLVVVAVAAVIVMLNQETPTDRIVLLPGEDGKVGKVTVTSGGSEQTLATAYAGAQVEAAGKIVASTDSAVSVSERYGAVLAARPQKAVSMVVYFASGGSELTAESAPVIAELKAELARRPAPEVTVIGHTDRVGKLEANDALSLKRAELVRALLIEQGIAAKAIEAAGRGEREPLVATADDIAEAKNRRVEITIR